MEPRPLLSFPGALNFRSGIGPLADADRLHYTNAAGGLDFGALMEYLDLRTAGVAMRQARPEAGEQPVATVAIHGTAISRPLTLDMDYDLEFRTTRVWDRSMEIAARITGTDGASREELLTMYFTFVGITDGRAAQLPPAHPRTAEELRHWAAADARKEAYARTRAHTIDDLTAAESDAIAALQHSYAHEGAGICSGSTLRSHDVLMAPRDRNPNGTVFGGYLARLSFNDAWLNAHGLIGGGMPLVAAIERINFVAPVHIGDIVRIDTQAVYSHRTSLVEQVRVLAKKPSEQNWRLTNTCTYTFVGRTLSGEEVPAPAIVPQTDDEKVAWMLADRRRVEYEAGKVIDA